MKRKIKSHFPIFENEIYYFDSAATTQRPKIVIDAINEYYTKFNANAGRGSHELSIMGTTIIENTRKKVKEFINCDDTGEIIFTKNCTEAINIVAYSYALNNLKKNDEILLCVSNHHSNIVAWQYVARKLDLVIKYIYLDENGQLDIEDMKYKLNENTKLVAISTVVNTTGIIQPFEKVIKLAHKKNAIVLLDCAQSIVHFEHDVVKWDADFITFSGHKMYASFGVGVLYAKKSLLDKMPPFIYGGDMVDNVLEQKTTYKPYPHCFEGGTMDTCAIYTLSKAIDFINSIGFAEIQEIENRIMMELMFELTKLDFLELYYVSDKIDRVGIISFNVKNVHSHDTAFILDKMKVMVRSGHHCTKPLLDFMKVYSACRISLGVYNDRKDIEKLVLGLKKVKEVFLSE